MRAAQFMAYGQPSVLEIHDVPTPVAGPGDALVRVHASSINPHDLIVRSGGLRFLTGSKFPLGTGLDFAGVVEAVGTSVTGLSIGERVWGVLPPTGRHATGAAADYVVLDAQRLATTPSELTDVDAAGLAVVGTTAFIALHEKLKLKKGDRLLIRGAAGGVGAAALQVARAIGAEVTALVSPKDEEFARTLGASTVLNYKTIRPSDLQQYDVILDCAGTELLRYREKLKPGGRMVTVNFGSWKAMIAIASSAVFAGRRIRAFSANPKKQHLDAVADFVRAGSLRAFVGEVFPLEAIAAAHESVGNGSGGKRVIAL